MVECCATCGFCISYPKNNRYGDVEYLCASTGYFVHGINKDRHTVRRFTPGGKELVCNYRKKEE